METFILGNKIEVKDGQHGWAVVKFKGYTMFVNALVVCEDTPNYCDIIAVSDAISKYAKKVQREISAHEAYDALIEKFGGAKVVCEEIEDERMNVQDNTNEVTENHQMSYRQFRGYCLDDKSVFVCGYEGMTILIQCTAKGIKKPKKYGLYSNKKGTYFNLKGKRVYVEVV